MAQLLFWVVVALIALLVTVSMTGGDPAVGFVLVMGTLLVTLAALAIREGRLSKKEQEQEAFVHRGQSKENNNAAQPFAGIGHIMCII